MKRINKTNQIKIIPRTSYSNYISGYYSLNTPDKNGNVSDWHPLIYWAAKFPNQIVDLTSNHHIIGNYGIEYRNIKWCNQKVHIATFNRAVIDMIYYENNQLINRGIINDFIFDDNDKEEIFNKLLIIRQYKDIDNILLHEFPIEFAKGVKNGTIRLSKRENTVNEGNIANVWG